jgi:hypothetical protein
LPDSSDAYVEMAAGGVVCGDSGEGVGDDVVAEVATPP